MLAERLLEKEVIFSDDLEQIFGPRKNNNPDSLTEPSSSAIEEPKEEVTEEGK